MGLSAATRSSDSIGGTEEPLEASREQQGTCKVMETPRAGILGWKGNGAREA